MTTHLVREERHVHKGCNLAKRAPHVLRISKVLSEFDQRDDIIMCVFVCVYVSISVCDGVVSESGAF